MHFLLFYELVPDYVNRRAPLRAEPTPDVGELHGAPVAHRQHDPLRPEHRLPWECLPSESEHFALGDTTVSSLSPAPFLSAWRLGIPVTMLIVPRV